MGRSKGSLRMFQTRSRTYRTLKIELDAIAVAPLNTAIRSVTRLRLDILNNDGMFLPIIASIVNLRELEIIFYGEAELPASDLLALRNLKALRAFKICPWKEEVVSSPEFTDRDFIQLLAGMSSLERFYFNVECELSIEAMISLGEHCRQLQTCLVRGSHDLYALSKIQAPLFPQLDELVIDATATAETAVRQGSRASVHIQAQEFERLLLEHAPNLKVVSVLNRHALCVEVEKLFWLKMMDWMARRVRERSSTTDNQA